jgi:hypothetical protein
LGYYKQVFFHTIGVLYASLCEQVVEPMPLKNLTHSDYDLVFPFSSLFQIREMQGKGVNYNLLPEVSSRYQGLMVLSFDNVSRLGWIQNTGEFEFPGFPGYELLENHSLHHAEGTRK